MRHLAATPPSRCLATVRRGPGVPGHCEHARPFHPGPKDRAFRRHVPTSCSRCPSRCHPLSLSPRHARTALMLVATLWPHDETAHQCPAAFGAAPHCGTMMLCRPRRLCRLVARVVTTPLLASALALFLHQYPVTPMSATASSWSIKGRIRVAPPSLPTHFQPTRPPSQTWLTHPLGSTRARFCSLLSLRPPFRGKSPEHVVLLVSTACYLA